VLAAQGHGFVAGAGFGNDLYVIFGFQQAGKPSPNEGMIVGDKYANHKLKLPINYTVFDYIRSARAW
jgi:hypothetical protein